MGQKRKSIIILLNVAISCHTDMALQS